jgi:hypothetical protein
MVTPSRMALATGGVARVVVTSQALEMQDGFLRAGWDQAPPSGACGKSDLGRLAVVGNGSGPAKLYICDDSSNSSPVLGEWIVK